jgi:hypothetical protein
MNNKKRCSRPLLFLLLSGPLSLILEPVGHLDLTKACLPGKLSLPLLIWHLLLLVFPDEDVS